MDNNELNRLSELIWAKLNCIENESKTIKEQIELIKPVLIELYSDSIKIGRSQVLNHLENEIKGLRA